MSDDLRALAEQLARDAGALLSLATNPQSDTPGIPMTARMTCGTSTETGADVYMAHAVANTVRGPYMETGWHDTRQAAADELNMMAGGWADLAWKTQR